ncbi:penicillin acylase family protein [Haloechinothrix sp. YIM 98757]|uniref:Penicillin acylase family protein n=1 Tax=Haloechinothrix aidingensis TaxID=2752311 RepID=A0A838A7N5_9PSEU|nr:penicillin acylase family protein [Haloechinothrix aidingensis]
MRASRSLAVLTASVLTVSGPVTGALAQTGPSVPDPADDYGTALNIMPPGQAGTTTPAELAEVLANDPENRNADASTPSNVGDQLEPYDELNTLTPEEISGSDLTDFYKQATFTAPPESEWSRPRQTFPGRHDLTITWDGDGVPHIDGNTDKDVSWGAGYAGTLDRMFLMDVLRHAGAARSAEFLGPTDGNIAMDQQQLRLAPYTPEEAEDQLAAVAGRYGEEGQRLLDAADAFVDGINAAQEEMCPGLQPTGPDCPVEYAALQKKPEEWTRADVVYIASLVGGIFGKGGGAEYGNAMWFQKLRERLGEEEARDVYDDLRAKEDAEAPVTVDRKFPYGGDEGLDPSLPGVALPDLDPAATAPGSGALVGESELPALDDLTTGETTGLPGQLDTPWGPIDLNRAGRAMSNAALVGADHTRDGHPAAVFGPQTGYFAPQLWTEQVLNGPGIKARGVAFAGTHLFVQIGRGMDYAWSATSSNSDNVDTVVERLCEMDGSEPTVESEAYVRDGECVPMDSRTHEQTALPNATAPQAPRHLEFLVLRTHRGIVQLRTTVDGEPVAIVSQRSTYNHEVDSAVGFMRANDPDYVRDAESFQEAMHGIDYTFNWFYADDSDIAHFGSGLLPKRADGVEFDLPRWGDDEFGWQGFEPFDRHVQQVNPPSGYLINWNNKQAIDFAAADDQWGYGSVHRSQALSDRIEPMVEQRDVTPESLTAAVQDAATVDVRARYTLPHLLDALGDDPGTAEATTLLRAWLEDGAHREDRDRDGAYSHQAAIAVFDEWWESGTGGVAEDVLRGGLGELVGELPKELDNHPRHGQGSTWTGAWYSYVNKDLRQLLGEPVQDRWHRSYCGDGSLEECRSTLRDSLAGAIERVRDRQDGAAVAELTYDKSIDSIRSVRAGVVGVRDIDWQNRPTFQQVVQLTSGR